MGAGDLTTECSVAWRNRGATNSCGLRRKLVAKKAVEIKRPICYPDARYTEHMYIERDSPGAPPARSSRHPPPGTPPMPETPEPIAPALPVARGRGRPRKIDDATRSRICAMAPSAATCCKRPARWVALIPRSAAKPCGMRSFVKSSAEP